MRFSKTEFLTGKQCEKAIWLKYHKPEVFSRDCNNENAIENGINVGKFARQLFPGGELVSWNRNVENAVNTTQTLIAAGQRTIYEAAFAVDDCYSYCDIVKINDCGNGRDNINLDVFEVKSATSGKAEYIDDIALQYYLLTKAGYTVNSMNVVHINNKYVRGENLEIHELFKIVDLTQKAKEMSAKVESQLKRIRDTYELKDEPTKKIGTYCSSPYECRCIGYCWQGVPEYSVFNLVRTALGKKFELFDSGIVTLEEVAASEVSLCSTSRVQVDTHVSGKQIFAPNEIKNFLETLSFPLYFLDFETFMPAIPEYVGQRSYEKIPFQYSLHILEEDGAELIHKEFLAKEGTDPRRILAERLVVDIPRDMCVVAFNMTFERGVIAGLASSFLDLSEHLMSIHDNIRDLMVPFQKKHYYTKEMLGRYSIKNVLPAMFPNDEALSYKGLAIGNGEDAMYTYEVLHLMPLEEIEKTRKDLLAYCKLDTLGMVRIWERLREICINNK